MEDEDIFQAYFYTVDYIDELIPYVEDPKNYPTNIYIYKNKGIYENNIYNKDLSSQKKYIIKKETKKILFLKYYKWLIEEETK